MGDRKSTGNGSTSEYEYLKEMNWRFQPWVVDDIRNGPDEETQRVVENVIDVVDVVGVHAATTQQSIQ